MHFTKHTRAVFTYSCAECDLGISSGGSVGNAVAFGVVGPLSSFCFATRIASASKWRLNARIKIEITIAQPFMTVVFLFFFFSFFLFQTILQTNRASYPS